MITTPHPSPVRGLRLERRADRTDRDRSASVALLVFVAVELGMLAAVLVLARHQWFFVDEWDPLVARRAGSITDLLRTHNGNWSMLPILAYRGMFRLFGLHTYLPYQMITVLFHLTAGALLRTVIRRLGVSPWIATAAASLFVLFGSGYQDIIWGIQGFVGSLVFGLAQLLLADHHGKIGRRDWLGVLAGLASLMCSAVAVPMVVVVGLVTFVRRGWRAALFHVLPLAVLYTTWWLAYARSYYHTPTAGGHLGSWAEWVESGLGASFNAMVQLSGSWVAIGFGLLLVVGLWLAWSPLDRRELRARATTPVALMIGGILFVILTGWARVTQQGVGLASEGHYLYIFVAMSLPAIAVAADAFARRWPLVLPAALGLFLIGIPGNLETLASPPGGFSPGYQTSFRQLILSLPSSPVAHAVPRSDRPEPMLARQLTIGWLLDQKAAGRVPDPGPVDPTTKANATLDVAVQQTNTHFTLGPGGLATTSAAAAATSSAPPAEPAPPLVSAATNPNFGTILVDEHGRTLYTLTEGSRPISCRDCGGVWAPLLVPPGTKAPSGGPGVTGLGESRSGTVVTYRGYPLYLYSGDRAPGQTNGASVKTAGGTWHVVKQLATAKSCDPLVKPITRVLDAGQSIGIKGGIVDVTYFPGRGQSDPISFDPANGDTLTAAAGPLTLSLAPDDPSQPVTLCI